MKYSFLHDFGLLSEQVSFKSLCSLRVGGIADAVFYPGNTEQLQLALKAIKDRSLPYKIWGNGTNMLPSDQAYQGVIIKLSRFNSIQFDQNQCIAEAGASLIACAYFAAYKQLSGLEFAYGIPATIGGATVMNAGAYQSSIFDVIDSVQILKDGQVTWMEASSLNPSYRDTLLRHNRDWFVLKVKMCLAYKERSAIFALMEDRKHRRLMSQALDYPSAGSVFQNPPQQQAWAIIDAAGLRSYRIGGAKVSDKHSNFIINDQNANAADIKRLIETIQDRVKAHAKIDLKTEIELFNW
jgi:UDP-N-acetylmuramate dehydrogenase